MALPKLKDIEWVTTDCYGSLIDWEKGISDAFKREADRDGLTIDERPFLDRFFEIQAQIMSGSYELYAEVLRRAAVQAAEEIGWTIEPSRAQFLPDSVGAWPPFREANAAMDRLKERYQIGIVSGARPFSSVTLRMPTCVSARNCSRSARVIDSSPIVISVPRRQARSFA